MIDPAVQVSKDDLIGLRRRVERVVLASGQPSRSVLAGAHLSRFRGRGMDYQEARHYQAGDDIRTMDWRITARAGRPHVKVFQEERERPVVVLVELAPSMFFGTRGAFKSVTAARLAAAIGWAAIARHDRIGALLAYGEHQELQPAGGRRAVMRLIRALALAGDPNRASNGEPTTLAAELHRLRRVVRPGSLIFILSDFYSVDEDAAKQIGLIRRHNDLIACQVYDPIEVQPPVAGRYGITDGERAGVLDTTATAVRRRYEDHFARHHQAVQELAARQGVPLLRVSTAADPIDCLVEGLSRRPIRQGRRA